MEHVCITENERRFSQSEGTPPMQQNLLDRIGLYAEKEGAEEILAGTFEFPETGDPYMKDMVQEM